ncbi:MAG: 5-(carboxyamino)imidazole ribonucleotide synthase [Hyphomicrobiaceae bacterium]
MRALPPGSTIGILGGGQLGRMLAMAAARLGLECHVYSDSSGPAFDVAKTTTVGRFEDLDAIRTFAKSVDVITYEFENVPLSAAAAAAEFTPVRPGPKALEVAQDRLVEKRFLAHLDLAVAPFAEVSSKTDLIAGLQTIGTPAILKTTRLGYDGKGQVRLLDAQDPSWALGAIDHAPAVLEGIIDFAYEVSVLAVRGGDGQCRFYDIPLNTHRNSILDTSSVPAPLPESRIEQARSIARTIATALDYVGVLAVELFYLGDEASPAFIVNEIAPRVHNSGHWTLDACAVCQFENQIRAVAGWPLGPTSRHSDARMTNLIGRDVDAWIDLASGGKHGDEEGCLHLYGKNEARPGRKMGHITHLDPQKSG